MYHHNRYMNVLNIVSTIFPIFRHVWNCSLSTKAKKKFLCRESKPSNEMKKAFLQLINFALPNDGSIIDVKKKSGKQFVLSFCMLSSNSKKKLCINIFAQKFPKRSLEAPVLPS